MSSKEAPHEYETSLQEFTFAHWLAFSSKTAISTLSNLYTAPSHPCFVHAVCWENMQLSSSFVSSEMGSPSQMLLFSLHPQMKSNVLG